jgi:hypothetical protein
VGFQQADAEGPLLVGRGFPASEQPVIRSTALERALIILVSSFDHALRLKRALIGVTAVSAPQRNDSSDFDTTRGSWRATGEFELKLELAASRDVFLSSSATRTVSGSGI